MYRTLRPEWQDTSQKMRPRLINDISGYVEDWSLMMLCLCCQRNVSFGFLTEFTHSEGLIDGALLANESIQLAVQAGATGVQVPATRPHRIEAVRAAIGENITIASCGIGVQGGTFGAAIKAGANFEIIGRSIFGKPSPKMEARRINEAIINADPGYYSVRI